MPAELLPVRLSHILGYSGVGAIVRSANYLLVVQDIRDWTDRHGIPGGRRLPYVERVRAALEITEELREPPVASELDNGLVEGVCIPARRFPSWARCPGCSKLYYQPWRQSPQSNEKPVCPEAGCKRRKLEQVTWVLAHPEGYLTDVPWHFLAHSSLKHMICKVRDRLYLEERGHDKRRLRCAACNAEMIFRGDEPVPFGTGRMQPWTKNDLVPASEQTSETTPTLYQILAINDSRVYSPQTVSALVIPPESRVRKGTVVDQLYRNSEARARIDSARNPLARKSAVRTLATEFRCSPGDIEAALNDLNQGYPQYDENFTPGQLEESEFKAFLEVLPNQRDDEDLVTHNLSEPWHSLSQTDGLDGHVRQRMTAIKSLVKVDRLKAVRVFRGFTRTPSATQKENPDTPHIVPPDIVGITDWLPALELYGEGIFITLDEHRLLAWEQHPAVNLRLNQLMRRFEHSGLMAPPQLTARFMLLHTLSHLLMRQIESEAGYPAASLNERLYCATGPEPMAGILIHFAVPDIAGSLGGLAELAIPRRFLGLLTRALEHAEWCSLDPVCSEHEGQGPGLLNRAACHACTLVPDTACNFGNALLDRCFVKGDSATGLPSFFGLS